MSRIEAQGQHEGMDWACLIMDGGWRCGYVRIPDGHRLHGLGYDDPAPGASWDQIAGEPVGKRGILELVCGSRDESPRLSVLFGVHGSLTFAGELTGLDGWWLGFDCNHSGDRPDPDLAVSESWKRFSRISCLSDGEIRDLHYVAGECHRLIDQIVTRYDVPKEARA